MILLFYVDFHLLRPEKGHVRLLKRELEHTHRPGIPLSPFSRKVLLRMVQPLHEDKIRLTEWEISPFDSWVLFSRQSRRLPVFPRSETHSVPSNYSLHS